jgi:hypothetical protein
MIGGKIIQHQYTSKSAKGKQELQKRKGICMALHTEMCRVGVPWPVHFVPKGKEWMTATAVEIDYHYI